jgi:hypothetical protein
MASPLKSGKQAVDLASSGARVSRIRRDPPPKLKEIPVRDPEDRDREDVMIGVIAFALAIFIIILAIASYNGWSPRNYSLHFED